MIMKNRTATTAQTPEELLNDLRALVHDAELMLNGSPDEQSSTSFSALQERFEAARQRLSDLYTSTKNTITAGVKYTDQTIRANPYQSLAIALGTGLLIGVLVGRRSQ